MQNPIVDIQDGYYEELYVSRILRPLNLDDFTFEVEEYSRPYEKSDRYIVGYSCGINVRAIMKPEVLQHLKAAFESIKGASIYSRKWHDHLKHLIGGGRQDAISSKLDFRGCSGHEARAKRVTKFIAAEMPKLREKVGSCKFELVLSLDQLIQCLVREINQYYEEVHVQQLTNLPWEDLEKECDAQAIWTKASELRCQAEQMMADLRKTLNAKALETMEKAGWALTDPDNPKIKHTLTSNVVIPVKKAYQEWAAFSSGNGFRRR